MQELIEVFTIEQVLLFIILLAVAVKGVCSWIEWAREKLKGKFNKEQSVEEVRNQIKENIIQLNKNQEETNRVLAELTKTVDLLVKSDKDDIKAWITEKHHYFCYELGYIDDFNLDCIEKRYENYKAENGNSYIGDLMNEIRTLPKKDGVSLYKHID